MSALRVFGHEALKDREASLGRVAPLGEFAVVPSMERSKIQVALPHGDSIFLCLGLLLGEGLEDGKRTRKFHLFARQVASKVKRGCRVEDELAEEIAAVDRIGVFFHQLFGERQGDLVFPIGFVETTKKAISERDQPLAFGLPLAILAGIWPLAGEQFPDHRGLRRLGAALVPLSFVL